MILGIQGTRSFNKYQSIFIRGMGRALSLMKDGDKEFTVYTAGPANINSMAHEFVNVSNFKARGIKAMVKPVPPKWIKQNIHDFDMFLYFCSPKEPLSELCEYADQKNIEAEAYRY